MRKIAAFDPLDAEPELPTLGLIRFCGALRCRRRARPGGRHCSEHHAAAVRRWRDGQRTAINQRRRDRAENRSPEQRRRDSARAKLGVAIARGKVIRGRCQACGSRDNVIAYQPNPAAPLEVLWFCRDDRRESIDRRRAEAEQAVTRAAWAARRAKALMEFELLPPPTRSEIETAAARGPAGMVVSPGSQLFIQQIVREVERRRA